MISQMPFLKYLSTEKGPRGHEDVETQTIDGGIRVLPLMCRGTSSMGAWSWNCTMSIPPPMAKQRMLSAKTAGINTVAIKKPKYLLLVAFQREHCIP